MQYQRLGNTGLKISRLSYGNWVNSKEANNTLALDLVKCAWDHGVNCFDTAEAYDDGMGEIQLGKALNNLKVSRMDYVLMTKIFFGRHAENAQNGQNTYARTNRKHLVEGLERSLRNLEHDYVDVVFCHRYDAETPVLEVCQTMKDLIAKGKALYWGTSEWPAFRILEAMHLADKINGPRPCVEQCQYSMLVRQKMEVDYTPLFDEYGMGSTIWSPLASGILTGKYLNGVPEGSRFAENPRLKAILDSHTGGEKEEKFKAMMKGLMDIAKELECTMPQLALAWTLVPSFNTCSLIGASSVKQLEENFKALDVVEKLRNKEVSERVEALLGNRPEQYRAVPFLPALPHRR